jgi:hypothetical protein
LLCISPDDFLGDPNATDHTTAIQTAINVASSGIGVVSIERDYHVTGPLWLTDNVRIVFGQRGRIIKDGAFHLFQAQGGVGAKTLLEADALMGAFYVALPTGAGAGFAAGDWIGLESTEIVISTDGRPREMHRVIRVSGDTVYLDAPLSWSYTTANAAKFFKWSPVKDICFEGGEIVDLNPASLGYTFMLQQCARVRMRDVKLTNCSGGIGFIDCQDVQISGGLIDRLSNRSTAYGYGVWLFGACANVAINGLIGHAVRHLFTTLAQSTTTYGMPQDVTLTGCIGTGASEPDSLAIFDTHPYGQRISFIGCHAVGAGVPGGYGFQLRAPKTRLVGCSAFHSDRAVQIVAGASDCQVIGGEFAYARSSGAISLGGARAMVEGAHIHDNVGAGIIAGDDCLISGNRLTDNAYGVQNISSSNAVIAGNVIPKSTKQTIAVLAAGATTVIQNNVARGYADQAAAFYNADASAVIQGNIL